MLRLKISKTRQACIGNEITLGLDGTNDQDTAMVCVVAPKHVVVSATVYEHQKRNKNRGWIQYRRHDSKTHPLNNQRVLVYSPEWVEPVRTAGFSDGAFFLLDVIQPTHPTHWQPVPTFPVFNLKNHLDGYR